MFIRWPRACQGRHGEEEGEEERESFRVWKARALWIRSFLLSRVERFVSWVHFWLHFFSRTLKNYTLRLNIIETSVIFILLVTS